MRFLYLSISDVLQPGPVPPNSCHFDRCSPVSISVENDFFICHGRFTLKENLLLIYCKLRVISTFQQYEAVFAFHTPVTDQSW